MNIEKETQLLITTRLLRTEQDINQFEQTIAKILGENNIDHIKHLCLGFDDATEHEEVMFGLVHAIEAYDKTYSMGTTLSLLADSLPGMLPQAKEWMKIIHKRIINHEASRTEYANVIANVNLDIKEIVVQQLDEIKNKNPEKFEKNVTEFLSAITTGY